MHCWSITLEYCTGVLQCTVLIFGRKLFAKTSITSDPFRCTPAQKPPAAEMEDPPLMKMMIMGGHCSTLMIMIIKMGVMTVMNDEEDG